MPKGSGGFVLHDFFPGLTSPLEAMWKDGLERRGNSRQKSDGPFMLHDLSIFLLPALMIIAAVTDVMSYRIPNWLTILIAVLFFPMALLTHMPLAEFGSHLSAGVILFVLGYALFAFGLFGGGDSKLMAAAGLWFGTSQTMPFLVLTALAGGLLAAGVMVWSVFMVMWDFHDPVAGTAIDKGIRKMKPKLPYGFAFAVGAILAFPQTWWMNVG
jgi:prepilin peptidase CpaA